MLSVLLQTHGDRLRPVVYFSSKLDPVAAAEKAVTTSQDLGGPEGCPPTQSRSCLVCGWISIKGSRNMHKYCRVCISNRS
ncbi:hypothetical protein MHYP_G00028490 [Metynnis hypsauchen]